MSDEIQRVLKYVRDYGLPATEEQIDEARNLVLVYGVDVAAALYVLKHGFIDLSIDMAIEYLQKPKTA